MSAVVTPISAVKGIVFNDAEAEAQQTRLVNATADVFTRLVNPTYFLEATRDSGYKGTAHAIAELVDNSIQARASETHIHLEAQDDDPNDIWVYVYDNGLGMDRKVLSLAPQFGGSSRFGDRSGLGRFGMGLPNSSVSQCRRFEVYSQKKGEDLFHVYLDLDEVQEGKVSEDGFLAPTPVKHLPLPEALAPFRGESGTLVIWRNCDRLDPKNIDALKKRLMGFLGEAFRNFIYVDKDVDGNKLPPTHTITVNGSVVYAFDPLFLDARAEYSGGDDRGTYHYDLPTEQPGKTSRVTVRFSMLPVETWQRLPVKERNAMRVVGKSASKGFCIVRAGREVEVTERYFLLGRKDVNGDAQEGRIENNDAWWRCEISFNPELDKLFGITHTKQSIHPNVQAMQTMREEITTTVTTLRNEYKERKPNKTPGKALPSEETATRSDAFLPPPPEVPQDPKEVEERTKEYVGTYTRQDETPEQAEERVKSRLFTIELESAKEGPFYRTVYLGSNTVVYLNTDHPFYNDLYAALDNDNEAQNSVQLLLFTLARAERQAGQDGKLWYMTQRAIWSQILWAYLSK